MISSFFSKSKPIHFVIVSSILFIVFLVAKYFSINEQLDMFMLLKQLGLFMVALLSVFVLDFFVSRNNLTKKNSYKVLLYVLFIALFPETLLNSKVLFANLFILLALRRLVSIRTQKEIKKKLFDAAFWISVATLLYFWASLFYVLIFVALILYSIADAKNWVIPIISIVTVLIISMSFMMLQNIDYIDYFLNLFSVSFDFSQLNSKRIIIGATLLFSYGVWSLFYFLKHLKSRSKNYKPSFILIIFAVLIAVFVIVLAPLKNGSEFLFLFAPLAIIITNYLELVTEKWFKEVLIVVLILTPILTLML